MERSVLQAIAVWRFHIRRAEAALKQSNVRPNVWWCAELACVCPLSHVICVVLTFVCGPRKEASVIKKRIRKGVLRLGKDQFSPLRGRARYLKNRFSVSALRPRGRASCDWRPALKPEIQVPAIVIVINSRVYLWNRSGVPLQLGTAFQPKASGDENPCLVRFLACGDHSTPHHNHPYRLRSPEHL